MSATVEILFEQTNYLQMNTLWLITEITSLFYDLQSYPSSCYLISNHKREKKHNKSVSRGHGSFYCTQLSALVCTILHMTMFYSFISIRECVTTYKVKFPSIESVK